MPECGGLCQRFPVQPFTREQELTVREWDSDILDRNFHIPASAEVPALICRLLGRFLPYEVFPGRSMALLRRAFGRAKQNRAGNLTSDTIITLFVEQTGLPKLFLSDDIPLSFDTVVEG